VLTFIAGPASAVFPSELAQSIEAELRRRWPGLADAGDYESDPVDPLGWQELQLRAVALLGNAPQIAGVEAYQGVYVPARFDSVQQIAVPSVADPLQAGSLDALLDELRRFAGCASLPVDDVELMGLANRYLEDDALVGDDLDVQTFVQLMLAAKQAAAARTTLWVVAV
jgi:hypothetical protein